MMSYPPPSPFTSSSPSPLGSFDASPSDADFNCLARERAWALMMEMGFDDEEEPLPSSLTGWQDLSPHSQEFSPTRVFNKTPSTPPTPTPTGVTPVRGASPTLDSSQVPLRSKLAKKRSLLRHAELSVFDILNTFWHHWFISVDHLRTTVLSAQKAKDGKISWVEFTPQFHAHLVKYTVALVPHPLQKVKQVMFVYLLELLNGEGPQSFFNLTKGQRIATQAQKDKWWLAWKRNHTLRWEHQKVMEEAEEGLPQWQCKACRWKFTSHKAAKRHRCSISKGTSRTARLEKGKGKTIPPS
jgi:hypothetical protein